MIINVENEVDVVGVTKFENSIKEIWLIQNNDLLICILIKLDKKNKSLKIIGISAYYHDSACCLSINGEIISNRKNACKEKTWPVFLLSAILAYHSKLKLSDIDYIVYYEKPLLTFERLLETYLAVAPRGIRSFIAAMQTWLKEKLFLKNDIKNKLKNLQRGLDLTKTKKVILPELLFSEHHLSHAASAFYPSPFKQL